MRHATAAVTIAAAGILLAGCSSSSHDDALAHYASAQAIADKLEAAGFTVSMLHKSEVDPSLGMDVAYDFTVTAKPGPAPGDSGINMFRNHQALTTWVGLSKGFGGIAVTGDIWAVSLTTDNAKAVASSKTLAPKIAQVLGGTVQE